MKKNVNRFIYWTPRILSFVFAAFLTIFSFDVFDEATGFWQTALALFLHNIPSLILIAVAIIAWKHELVGSVAFGMFALLYCISAFVRAETYMIALSWIGIIGVPAILTAVLFYLNWKKKESNPSS